jgi:hypothetical protein
MRSSAPPTASSPDVVAPGAPVRRALALVAGVGLLGAAAVGAGLPAVEPSASVRAASRPSLPADRLVAVPFESGETLVYTVSWMGIHGGEMTLRTGRERSLEGVDLYRFVLTASSNDFVSTFYRVRTRYESWVDARDFQPVRFEKHAREGHYETDEVEEFDLEERVGSWRDVRKALPARIEDIVSSFYYLRTVPLVPGESVDLALFSRGKVYELSARVLGRERVETGAGTFEALKVQPQLRETAEEEDRNRGELLLWFSDDARRLLVRAKSRLAIGSATALLRQASPPAGPPWPPPAPPPAPSPAPG